jgi:predicted NodU family carbamoyl transferase
MHILGLSAMAHDSAAVLISDSDVIAAIEEGQLTLASPWAPYVKENSNDYVKHRESFRPFALAIREEHCAEYFHCSANERFLTTMATANEKGRQLLAELPPGFLLPGNLVRLHVVRSTDNPLFWKLLNDAGQNAPAPILVNVFQFIRRTTGGDAARCATELFLFRSRRAGRWELPAGETIGDGGFGYVGE